MGRKIHNAAAIAANTNRTRITIHNRNFRLYDLEGAAGLKRNVIFVWGEKIVGRLEREREDIFGKESLERRDPDLSVVKEGDDRDSL